MSVKVKVLGINGDKINLSMKKAEEQPQIRKNDEPVHKEKKEAVADEGFEDKLRKFMKESDSRMAGNPMYADRGKSRRR